KWLEQIREIGRDQDEWYCLRAFVPGRTLAERLEQGALSLAETFAVGRCLLTALRESHAQGLRHQNLKPSNLIVNAEAPVTQATLVDGGMWTGGQSNPENWVQ